MAVVSRETQGQPRFKAVHKEKFGGHKLFHVKRRGSLVSRRCMKKNSEIINCFTWNTAVASFQAMYKEKLGDHKLFHVKHSDFLKFSLVGASLAKPKFIEFRFAGHSQSE